MATTLIIAATLTASAHAADTPTITPQVAPSAADTPDVPTAPIQEPEPEPEPEPEKIMLPAIKTAAPEVYEAWESIPLEAEVQDHIFTLCEEKDIPPEIIFSMIWRESRYQVDIIGDSGRAFGLMQIHPRWHSERMERLGVETNDDLLDPIQNVTVGIDILDELYRKYGDITHAIVAYNKGHYAGKITGYAEDVLAEAENITAEREGRDL